MHAAVRALIHRRCPVCKGPHMNPLAPAGTRARFVERSHIPANISYHPRPLLRKNVSLLLSHIEQLVAVTIAVLKLQT